MGLDCWVYASDEPVKEEELLGVRGDGLEFSYTEYNLGGENYEVWYGRKTHSIMDYLLKEAYYEEDNCEYISLDHLDLDKLKLDFTKELISPEQIDEYDLENFKELIDALSEVPEDKYIYFYAWY